MIIRLGRVERKVKFNLLNQTGLSSNVLQHYNVVIIGNIWFYAMENQRRVPNTQRIVNSYGDRKSNKPDFIIAQ